MGDLDEKIAAGEPLLQQFVQAFRRYNEAKGVMPDEEVERLRLEAEALIAVSVSGAGRMGAGTSLIFVEVIVFGRQDAGEGIILVPIFVPLHA